MVSYRREASGLKTGMGWGGPKAAPEAPTAPATVSGERLSRGHWGESSGKAEGAQRPASQETGHAEW